MKRNKVKNLLKRAEAAYWKEQFNKSTNLQTAQAGGAVALSVLLTVFCNLAAVFTVPPLVAWIINFEDVRLDPVKLLIKLVLTVLLPLLVCAVRLIVV